ncbi:MAG: hypothetical protein A2Y78_00115 [Acidobacteria bacterium RBG_13_68_16]|nr:MAG: hypothetical protein A2Y78_00115 [Acidobacteria bacterium RBG_13_68_16]
MAKGSGGPGTGGASQASGGALVQGIGPAEAGRARDVLGIAPTESAMADVLGVSGIEGARVSAGMRSDGAVVVTAVWPVAGGEAHITRTFRRGPKGLTVHHDNILLPEAAQGAGLARPILAQQFRAYDRLGVKRVTLDAAKTGRYVWPRAGYEAPADQTRRVRAAFERQTGVDARGMSVGDIARHPKGKAFLTSPVAPTIFGMHVDRGTPGWASVRAYLERT